MSTRKSWWEQDDDFFGLHFGFAKRAGSFEGDLKTYKKRRSMMDLTRRAYMTCRIHGVEKPVITFDHLDMSSNGSTTCKGDIHLNPMLIEAYPLDEHEALVLGVALHEAEHNLISEPIMGALKEASQLRSKALNFCEDARVEWSARKRSPGFAPYMDKRSEITLTRGVEKMAEKFPTLDPFKAACSIALMTLKYDRGLPDYMVTWNRDGVTPFLVASKLRALCTTEEGVLSAAKELEKLFKYFARESDDFDMSEYEDGGGSGGDSGGTSSSEGGKGDASESGSDGEGTTSGSTEGDDSGDDSGSTGSDGDSGDESDGSGSTGEGSSGDTGAGSSGSTGAGSSTPWGPGESIAAAGSAAKIHSDHMEYPRSCETEEYRSGEIGKTIDYLNSRVRGTVDAGEGYDIDPLVKKNLSQMVAAVEADIEDQFEEGAPVTLPGSRETRKVIWATPKIGGRFTFSLRNQKYLHKSCAKGIKKLGRKVALVRHADRNSWLCERQEGELDFDKLATAKISRRVFKLANVCKTEGLSLCLLLDESGSMEFWYDGEQGAYVQGRGRATKAMEMAYTIVSALRQAPKMEIFAYSHGSTNLDQDCLIKRLYSPEYPDIRGLFNYSGSCQNYDHMAIKSVGEEFLQKAKCEKKMMLVLSDGEPFGCGYGGVSAIKATGEEVRKLEKKGVHMSMLQVGGANPKDMFTHFLDLREAESKGDLVSPLSKFLVKQMKKSKVGV